MPLLPQELLPQEPLLQVLLLQELLLQQGALPQQEPPLQQGALLQLELLLPLGLVLQDYHQHRARAQQLALLGYHLRPVELRRYHLHRAVNHFRRAQRRRFCPPRRERRCQLRRPWLGLPRRPR